MKAGKQDVQAGLKEYTRQAHTLGEMDYADFLATKEIVTIKAKVRHCLGDCWGFTPHSCIFRFDRLFFCVRERAHTGEVLCISPRALNLPHGSNICVDSRACVSCALEERLRLLQGCYWCRDSEQGLKSTSKPTHYKDYFYPNMPCFYPIYIHY